MKSEAARDTPGRRALVVDDDESMRKLLARLLSRWGFRVSVAADGGEAWRLLLEGGFDLVITDNAMPDMRGEELARKARASFPNLPILMLTALNAFQHAGGGLPPGVDQLLLKPASPQEIQKAVQQLLD